MVKWYNESLPRISGGFDSLWPHEYKKEPFGAFFVSLAARHDARAARCQSGGKEVS